MHIKFFLFFWSILLLFSGFSFSQQPPSAPLLDELISEGLRNNPQLKAYRQAFQSASRRIPQAGALPDPVLSLNVLNLPTDRLVFDQEPMSGKQLGLKQTLPFPGKLRLREKIAQADAAVSRSTYLEFKNQLIKEIRQTYFNLSYLDQALVLTRKNQSLLREFVTIAEKKYTVGKGLQQDVLKAQVAYSQMRERLIALKRQRDEMRIRLNFLLNRPAQSPLGQTQMQSFKALSFQRDSLVKRAEKQRPLLQAWQFRLNQSRERMALAKRNYWPDITVSLAYTQRDRLVNGAGGTDFLSGGVSVQLPLYFWRKQRQRLEETRIRLRSTRENLETVRNRVRAAIESTLSALQKDARRITLYESGILPQASQAMKSALIGYQTDKVDFLTLLNSQITLFNLQLKHVRLLADYQNSLAELAFITGTHKED